MAFRALVAAALTAVLWLSGPPTGLRAQEPAPTASAALDLAQHHFYSGRYETTIEHTAALRSSESETLAALELRTSALHFQIKRLVGDSGNKGRAFKQCAPCADLFATFMKDTAEGKALARARLKTHPKDEATLFFLGKFDLNYIWLQLSTLGRKTGWGEYWDARKTLDAVLKINPANVRARVARAWIDYIVDTRVPFGVQWMLGGGDKKRAMNTMREAAVAKADVYVRAEAEFALWEMLVREKQKDEAMAVAKRLAAQFPDNAELARFVGGRP